MKIKRITPNEPLVREYTKRHRAIRNAEKDKRNEAQAQRILMMLVGRDNYIANLPPERW